MLDVQIGNWRCVLRYSAYRVTNALPARSRRRETDPQNENRRSAGASLLFTLLGLGCLLLGVACFLFFVWPFGLLLRLA